MQLSKQQIDQYQEHGYLVLENRFSEWELQVLKNEIPYIFNQDSPARVLEKGSRVVRSVYGSHTHNEYFRRLSLHPRIAEPVIQILDNPIYVYQFKINAKTAFDGDTWEWHQDFIFWFKEDGMPKADALTVAVFLDDVNDFNGPILFIPGSHKEGMIDRSAFEAADTKDIQTHYGDKPAWISNLTATLKYSLDRETVAWLVEKYGITAAKGPRGSVLIFDCNVAHSSATNMSPFNRNMILVTYNSTANIPKPQKEPRPEFLASRDHIPVIPVADNALAQLGELSQHAALAHKSP